MSSLALFLASTPHARRAAVAALLGLGVVVTGCSSSSSSSTATIGSAQACANSANARCARIAGCSPIRMQTQYADQASCVSLLTNNCMAAVGAPSSGNTAEDVEACAEAVPGWACSDFLDSINPPSACVQHAGSLGNGSPCGFPGQCSSGFCAIPPSSGCGTCAAAPAAGASCAQLSSCGMGMVCTADTQTCAVVGGQGAACGVGAPCGTDLSCVGADASTKTMGTCMASVALKGSTCDPTGATGPGCNAELGLTCSATSKTCVAIAVASSGDKCGQVNGELTLCGGAASCIGSDATTEGSCVSAAATGAKCNDTTGPACGPVARCIVGPGVEEAVDASAGGTCVLPSATSCQ